MIKYNVTRLAVLSSVIFLTGCPVYETTTTNVDQAQDSGHIQFLNATSAHRIFVDGKLVGTGDDYSSSKVLAVPPGPHSIVITQGDTTVLSQKVFIGVGSTRAVEIR
jgi:hypothetical protein